MSRTRIAGVALLVVALSAPAVVTAQEGTVSWVYMYKAHRGQGGELVELIKEHFGAETEAQIAAGNLNGWGIASKANYDGGYTHIEWLNHPSWEAAAEAEAAFDAAWQAKSKGEKEAIQRGFSAVLEERSFQRVATAVVRNMGDGETPPKYLVMGEFQARPGKATAGTRIYSELAVPVYDGLLNEGAIGAYGMAVPAMHDKGGWTHWTWYTLDGLGGMDAVSRALGGLADEETDRRIAEIFDMSAHRDTIYRIEHLGGAASSE